MYWLLHFFTWLLLLQTVNKSLADAETEAHVAAANGGMLSTLELPQPLVPADGMLSGAHNNDDDEEADLLMPFGDADGGRAREARSRRHSLMDIALEASAREGLEAMTQLYRKIEPDIIRNGQLLADNHPAAMLSKFSAPVEDTHNSEMAAFAAITASKAFKKNYKHINELARQAHTPKISLRRTSLEGLCPPREPPTCMPASERYRTHDGTCNNQRRPRWGAAQMPFNRFLPPEYGDGVDTIRNSIEGGPLSSSRFVSLLVHGAKDGEAALTLMTAQWGQLLDHDVTSTAQPRSINGSVPSCCGSKDFHPSCFPIKVPLDDPWLAPLKVRCLEFLRSAPAQRRDCVLSWREQTNQATSYIDASPIYSSSAKSSDNARVFRNGLLVYGRGNPEQDVCQRGAIATQCIRSGDGRSGEQPGLLALHHVWVGEHNRIAMEISEMNLHWSDEKIYQETRRIIGAMFQHITYREFLPIVLGREVCKLFDLELKTSGYFEGYDVKTNPTVANSFAAAAFRFGHSLIQNSYMRCDRHHNRINNNVSLHEEFQRGDIGSAGSLHRLIRGLATQRALKRDEFITPELTNHLFQTPGFPFGLDLAAINIQRGRDHGTASYTAWRVPCGLTPITSWADFANVVGPESAKRIGHAYRSVHDIDLFVGGISERPVIGGLVGPTFACIIAQQFSNSRKGDRFWYENGGFESSFTPAQLHSIRRVSLAQVLCRAVGGGTFQPHIFIPHEFPGNERIPCGAGSLTPIDLGPWLEQDPFDAPMHQPTFETTLPDRVFDIIPNELNTNSMLTIPIVQENKTGFNNRIQTNTSVPHKNKPNVDFVPNSSTGFQRPHNVSKINDKLDFKRKNSPTKRPTQKPILGVNNKLDKRQKITLNIKSVNRHRVQSTTRRTVIVNNIPIELRTASTDVTNKPKTDHNPNSTQTHKNVKITQSKKNDTVRQEIKLESRADVVESDMKTVKDKRTDTLTVTNDNENGPFNTKVEDIMLNDKELRLVDLKILNHKHNRLSKTKLRSNLESIANSEQVSIEPSITRILTKTLVNMHDKDIDPMTHSPSKEHIRVQRKLEDSNVTITNETLDFTNISSNARAYKNRFTNTTKLPKTTTEPNEELRQYQTRPIYTRPQKVVVDGPNSDQYEIEINIRQTNKSPVLKPNSNYAEYTTAYKPYGYDRYTSPNPNYANYASTTPVYGYYQQPPSTSSDVGNFAQVQRTKPPTIIYLNEHDEQTTTTTRQPGILQNFISFATSGFGVNRPIFHKEKEKPVHAPNPFTNQELTNTLISSPHSSVSAAQYIPPAQDHPLSPVGTSSFSQVGSYPNNGVSHASSGAVSNGHFGSIIGVASANGADSTFSFNIRPRPTTGNNLLANQNSGTYGLLPPRRPPYAQVSTPQYINTPQAPIVNEPYHLPNREPSNSPFSTGNKRPIQQNTYLSRTQTGLEQKEITNDILHSHDHKIDFDYHTKTLEPNDTETSKEDIDDSDEKDYQYDDDSDDDIDNDKPGTKFDRDGYLRPEHMIESLFKQRDAPVINSTNDNFTNPLDDNYVLPVLNSTAQMLKDVPMPIELTETVDNTTDTSTDYPDTMGKNLDSNILAEDYNDDLTELLPISKIAALTTITTTNTQTLRHNTAFAPIQILTKPERPDNWVIFETPEEKPLLPDLPEFNTDALFVGEVPMPFIGLGNVWLTKYRNKLEENNETVNNITVHDTEITVTNKTVTDITKNNDIKNRTEFYNERYATTELLKDIEHDQTESSIIETKTHLKTDIQPETDKIIQHIELD